MNEKQIEALERRLARAEAELSSLRSTLDQWRTDPQTRDSAASEPDATPRPAEQAARPSEKDEVHIALRLERFFGENLLGKIGVTALILAAGWFIKMAFDRHWINESGRIYVGVISGFAVGLGGLNLAKRDYRIIAPALIGAGFAIIYIAIFGAFFYYDLLTRAETFVFLVLISGLVAFFSVRADVQTLYLASLGGAMLAPFLLSSGENSYRFLFVFSGLVLLGFGIVSYFKNWRVASFAIVIGHGALFLAWASSSGDESSFNVPFAFVAFLHLFVLTRELWLLPRRGHRPGIASAILIAISVLYFSITGYVWVDQFYPLATPHFLVFVGATLLSALWLYTRTTDEPGDALRLLVESVPVILFAPVVLVATADMTDGARIGMAIVGLGASLSLWGALLRKPAYLFVSLPLWFAALIATPIYPVPPDGYFFLNQRFILFAVAFIGASGTYLVQRPQMIHKAMRGFAYLAIWFALCGTLFEVHDLVDDSHFRNLCYSYTIAVFAIVCLLVGFTQSSSSLRWSGIVLACIVVLKLYAWDLWTLDLWIRIIAFGTLGAALILLSIVYQRFRGKLS